MNSPNAEVQQNKIYSQQKWCRVQGPDVWHLVDGDTNTFASALEEEENKGSDAEDESKQRMNLGKVEELPYFPGQLTNVEDALDLPGLHEAALLDLIRRRLVEDENPCTWVGSVLVSLNPGKDLPGRRGISDAYFDVLTEDEKDQNQETSSRELTLQSSATGAGNDAPDREQDGSNIEEKKSQCNDDSAAPLYSSSRSVAHLASVADRAYTNMMAGPTRKSQTIMVNGESGAGKTEATKFITRCLARKSRKARSESSRASKAKVDSYFGKMGLRQPVMVGTGRGRGRGRGGRGGASGSRAPSLTNLAGQQPASAHAEVGSAVEEFMLKVSPVFEAFGNASTESNHNSSRFGKFLQLEYDRDGVLIGARTRHFLLEKTRVIRHTSRQRNFHIFYQLLARMQQVSNSKDTSPEEDEEFALGSCSSSYNYMTSLTEEGVQSSLEVETPCFSAADDQAMTEVREALDEIGVDSKHRKLLWQTLLCVLEIGNIEFQQADRGHGLEGCCLDSDSIRSSAALQHVANFLDVDLGILDQALCFRTVSAGGSKRSSVLSHPLTMTEALNSRDGLAKGLYTALFDFVVDTVNQRINVGNADKQVSATIGLLDVFGFEQTQKNSFEQLCMNYANEKLQHKFETHLLEIERSFLEDEGLDAATDMAPFEDSSDVIAALEDKTSGVLTVLDEASALNLTDAAFMDSLRSKVEHVSEIDIPKQGGALLFTIKHRAANVQYDAHDFVLKNNDALQADVADMLLQSKNDFVAKLFEASTTGENAELTSSTEAHDVNAQCSSPSVGGQRHSLRMALETGAAVAEFKAARTMASTKTIAMLFRRQLVHLDQAIEATSVHFVRCIKPWTGQAHGSAAKQNGSSKLNFHGQLVLNQLSHLSVLEMVRFRSAGFCGRFDHEAFFRKFRALAQINHCAPREGESQRKLAIQLLQHILPPTSYEESQHRVGLDHILLQSTALAFLNIMENILRQAAARKIQRVVRDKLLVDHKRIDFAVTSVQALWRGFVCREEYTETRLTIVDLQSWWRGRTVQLDYEFTRDAIIHLQSVIRMLLQYQEYNVVVHSAKTIQIWFQYWTEKHARKRRRRLMAVWKIQSWYRKMVKARLQRATEENERQKLRWDDSLLKDDFLRHSGKVICNNETHRQFIPLLTGVPDQTEAFLLLLQDRFVLATSVQKCDELLLTPETRVYARDKEVFFIKGVAPHLETVYEFKDAQGRAVDWVLAMSKPLNVREQIRFDQAKQKQQRQSKLSRRRGPLQLRQASSPRHQMTSDAESVATERSSGSCSVSSVTSSSRAKKIASSIFRKSKKGNLKTSVCQVWCELRLEECMILMYDGSLAKDPVAGLTLLPRINFVHLTQDTPVQVVLDDFSVPGEQGKLTFTSETSAMLDKWAADLKVRTPGVKITKYDALPSDVQRFVQKGESLEREKRFAEAVASFSRAVQEVGWPRLKSNTTAAKALHHRAACNYQRKWYCAAIHDAELALLAQPKNAQAHVRKGLAFMELGLDAKAKVALEEAINIDADCTEARTALANLRDKEKGHRICNIPRLNRKKANKPSIPGTA